MDPRWCTILLAVFFSQMVAISGETEHLRVARDVLGGLGAILETAKDTVNPEKAKDAIDVVASMLEGDQTLPVLGRKRRDLYNPSALVRVEDGVDALDSGEVNWRVAHVPGEMAKSGAESSGMSKPSDTPSERKRRAAQMPSSMMPSSMMPGGMDPEEHKQKAMDMMQSGAEASGMSPPPNMPSFPGRERKRRGLPRPIPSEMTPPSSMSDGMSAPPSMPDGMTPPSMPNGMTPPSSMPDGMTPPYKPDSMNPTQNAQTYGEMGKSEMENRGMTPPSKVPSDKKRKRRESVEDMTEGTQTKSGKQSKQSRGNQKGKGKGKGKGKNKIPTTTPAFP